VLRVPLVVLALAVLVAAAAAPLARADGGSVTIAPPGAGAERSLSLASLRGSFDVHDVTYALLAADGSTSRVTVADGISLRALLQAAGLDGDPFTYVEIPYPDGSGSADVLADHVGDAGDGPPVVWSDAQGVHFLRPSDGNGDVNAGDYLTVADGALSIALHTGEPLAPRVNVSPSPGCPHAPIHFSASLADGRALSPGMAFQWYFDGGAYVYGASVKHRFPAAATYKVELNVVRGGVAVTYRPTIVHLRIGAAAAKRTGGTGGAQGAGAGGTGAPTQAPPTAAPRPTGTAATAPLRRVPPPPLPARPRGQLVSGTLIASASAALPLAGGVSAAATAPSTASPDRPLHVPIGAWVAIGLTALLGLGWALESRHTLPFWQP
jgi:hypothetical protein